MLRKQIFSWINSKNTQDPIDFFNKTDFCLKTLLGINNIQEKMDINEKYAYNIGLIAGKYIKFKRKSQEESNSLKDILSYSKYDREKLRFVFSRVSIGLSLSKAEQSSINKVSKFINQNLQLEEIPDQSAFIDYSYFFFKGVYKELGGMMSKMKIDSKKEILFYYESRQNPNGDPGFENQPRLMPDGTIMVTDVRVKRTIRDYAKTALNETIFVDYGKEGNQ